MGLLVSLSRQPGAALNTIITVKLFNPSRHEEIITAQGRGIARESCQRLIVNKQRL